MKKKLLTSENAAALKDTPAVHAGDGCNRKKFSERFSKLFTRENAAKWVFAFFAAFSVFAVFAIIFYILYSSIPAFREIGVFNFIFGSTWAPTKEQLPVAERFGIFPMIISSLAVTAGAVLIGGVLGIFTAVFNAFFCPEKLKGVFSQIINLLAGIPSIIYGFFGLVVLVPLLAKISDTGSGKGLLASSLILGIMILPTVAGMAKNAIEAVPASYYEGALALGNTKEQAIFKVILPSAKSGIISGLILGVGRAIGETMAVMMVAGNSPLFPEGLFTNIRTLTINIVAEMAYSTGLHRQALIATGFVLLIFILILNICLGMIKKDRTGAKKGGGKVSAGDIAQDENEKSVSRFENTELTADYKFVKKGTAQRVLKWTSITISVAVVTVLLFIIGFILVRGLPYITFDFLFGKSGNAGMTLAPAFISTGMLIFMSLLIALPIGIGAAIYLVEYSKKGSKFVKVIRLFTDTLAGIPSIVFGLFGMIFFCGIMNMGYSLLAGSLTLVLIILPTIIRSSEESLLSVQDSLREGSLALGAGKVRTIFKVVLPSAISGIVTAVILSIGRIVGESAALIYTSGAVAYVPAGYLSQGSSFAVMMWMFAGEGLYINQAYATAAVLLIFVGILNAVVYICEKKLKRGKV